VELVLRKFIYNDVARATRYFSTRLFEKVIARAFESNVRA
jgi:hypothetical protein